MNPFRLFREDGSPTAVWVCGQCNCISGRQADNTAGWQRADECCRPNLCPDCGLEKPKDTYLIRCDACAEATRQRLYRERIEKSEKLESWDGWVYWEDQGYQDGFFPSLDDLYEFVECDGDVYTNDSLPEYVFVCKEVPFRDFDIDEVIEFVSQDSFEDAADQLEGLPELRTAIDVFNEQNKRLVSYEPDYARTVKFNYRIEPIVEDSLV